MHSAVEEIETCRLDGNMYQSSEEVTARTCGRLKKKMAFLRVNMKIRIYTESTETTDIVLT
jgi:hypothetical protein